MTSQTRLMRIRRLIYLPRVVQSRSLVKTDPASPPTLRFQNKDVLIAQTDSVDPRPSLARAVDLCFHYRKTAAIKQAITAANDELPTRVLPAPDVTCAGEVVAAGCDVVAPAGEVARVAGAEEAVVAKDPTAVLVVAKDPTAVVVAGNEGFTVLVGAGAWGCPSEIWVMGATVAVGAWGCPSEIWVMGATVAVGAWGCPSEIWVMGATVAVGAWGCPSEIWVMGATVAVGA
jgi:hypothetical protein